MMNDKPVSRWLRPAVLGAAWLLPNSLLAAEAARPGPATITHGVKEADLATVKLLPEAEQRLGLRTVAVERRRVSRTRTFGGDAIFPAPLPAQTTSAEGRTGQPSISAILPSLTATDLIRIAEAQVDADGQVDQARVALELAETAVTRAETLLRNKAGSERAVQEARAQAGQAAAVLRTAQARRALLAAPVLEVIYPRTLWVRVPVYVGDLPRLDTQVEAQAGGLAEAAGQPTRPAKLVVAPPSANPAAATLDLLYEVANDDAALRPGQRLGVTIPLREPAESLVIPWAAVLHDIHGGTWVYEQIAPQTFARRRVQVRAVKGAEALLASGPAPGAKIVTVGAAELFGAEFGVGK